MRRGAIVPVLAVTVVMAHAVYHLAGSCGGVERVPPPTVPTLPASRCPDRGPISGADWRELTEALISYVEVRQPEEIEPYRRGSRALIDRLASCQAQIHGDVSDLHAQTQVRAGWTGAHFRKTDWGWFVLGLDSGSGEIR